VLIDYLEHEDRPPIATVLRGFDLDVTRYPERTPEDWIAFTKAARLGRPLPGVQMVYEDHNAVNEDAMEVFASFLVAEQNPWNNGRWYVQALGSGSSGAQLTDPDLESFLYRKPFTENIRTGRIVTANTFFGAADFASHKTTVATAATASSFTVAAAGNLQPGDTLRVGMPGGYEYKTILAFAGVTVTLASPLSATPAVGTTIDQMVEESSVYGDKPANYTTGTVSVTNGSAVVTGAGTAWLANVGPGDKIRIGTSRKWYTIASVDSDTQITLSTAYTGATAAGQSYSLRGTMFNRANGLRYVKESDRAFVFENSWIWGG
jgi:hypothetical protein